LDGIGGTTPRANLGKVTKTTQQAKARGPRGAYAKTGARRIAILEAALQVFAEAGYRAATLREVAERVGMSEAGLIHHFPNKPALLAATLALRDQKSLERLPADLAPGDEWLHALIDLTAHNATQPGVVQIYTIVSAEAVAPDHPAHEYFINRYAWARSSGLRTFEKLAHQGRLADGMTATDAVNGLVALMDGLQLQWLLHPAEVDMATTMRAWCRTIIKDFN
jgi:AcrR family transcriptional regulator